MDVSTRNGGLVVAKFEPFVSGLFLGLVMFWFCFDQPNIRCVFHSPVPFLVSQPVDCIQALERKHARSLTGMFVALR